ncbi:group III truncated hemoglobin [Pelagibacterium lentulum]|uniref:Preprotein translocase subunit TatC n=1 Tax=Pelagibacterium lentulum TaxID=2029865 RepID=A0A916RIY0_9HYPH|nr:group III truncated hemoglobin [Pelagibacterium lentulum]GGA55592.1 preprotein translocase subunit TatC [Pelagibacterium lentulum]
MKPHDDNPLTRPGPAHPDITDDGIALLVRTFYDRAREDDVLGPIFNRAVQDWDEHIAQITDFWSSIMLRTGRYSGRPLNPHLRLPLEAEHFDRWLALFEQTATELFSSEIAHEFMIRARRIADNFELAIGSMRGEIRTPRHSR